ncbi:MAG: hypothetical protein H0T59_00675 [Chloroflexi bacterium]|nr:hypothetical protein [Chloroflexota bacterium]
MFLDDDAELGEERVLERMVGEMQRRTSGSSGHPGSCRHPAPPSSAGRLRGAALGVPDPGGIAGVQPTA